MDDISQDAFLGGRLSILQPRVGYRAGVDPVLLAASVAAKPGERVLDLGCGVGVAGLCLARRVPGVLIAGLEREAQYAALARRNGAAAGIEFEVHEGDLAMMPVALRQIQFDHVMANPPYFKRDQSTAAPRALREAAMGEETPMADWVMAAAKRTRPGGSVTFIQRVERLPELLGLMCAHIGSVQVLPLIPRAGRAAQLVLIKGRRGGRAPFRLQDGIVMHQEAAHPGDKEHYTPQISQVLREGGELPFPL